MCDKACLHDMRPSQRVHRLLPNLLYGATGFKLSDG